MCAYLLCVRIEREQDQGLFTDNYATSCVVAQRNVRGESMNEDAKRSLVNLLSSWGDTAVLRAMAEQNVKVAREWEHDDDMVRECMRRADALRALADSFDPEVK